MACKGACKTKGAYLAAMAKTLAWLGGKVEVIEDELGTFEDKIKTLGWREKLSLNGSIEWTVVEIIKEVELNGFVFRVSEDTVESIGITVVRAAISTDCWK